jgi:hypothetical protein
VKGFGVNEILRQLKFAGMGVQRKWGLETYAGYAGQARVGYAIQNVRPDYFADHTKLPLSETDMRTKYGMNVRIATTGEYEEDGITPKYKSLWVVSDTPQRTQWYLDKSQEYIATAELDKYLGEGEYVDPKVIEAVQRNPKFGRG